MKKLIILTSIVLILFIVIIIIIKCRHSVYELDYFSKLGISTNRAYTYENMINDFGEPIEITEDDKNLYAKYNEFYFRYMKSKDGIYKHTQTVTLTSATIRFGDSDIGIGSSKQEVNEAYKRAEMSREEINGISYRDGENFVSYYFDENDIVTSIVLGFLT